MTEDAELFNHAYSLATEAPADADGAYIFKTLRACIPLAPSSQIFVIGRLAYRINMPSDTLYQQFLHVLHGDIQMNNAKSALNLPAKADDKIEATEAVEEVKEDDTGKPTKGDTVLALYEVALRKIADLNTVAGMAIQDRGPRLAMFARNALKASAPNLHDEVVDEIRAHVRSIIDSHELYTLSADGYNVAADRLTAELIAGHCINPATDTVKVVSPLTAEEVEAIAHCVQQQHPNPVQYNRAKDAVQKLRACRLHMRAADVIEVTDKVQPTPSKAYTDMVIAELFRKNDVRPGSSFTHEACRALLAGVIEFLVADIGKAPDTVIPEGWQVVPGKELDALHAAARDLCEYGPNEVFRDRLRSAGQTFDKVRSSSPRPMVN